MRKIAIIDYGMGNLHSAAKALEKVGAGVTVTPYPVGYYTSRRDYWNALSWVPSAAAMRGTGLALKEYMGLAILSVR